MTNVNDTYFDGSYKEIWRSSIPEIMTTKEVDFILSYFNLRSGSNVLDIMCGYGRHSLSLARKGIHVTSVDNQKAYVDEVSKLADKEKLPIKSILSNVLSFSPSETFDLIICMGNSLNFFNLSDTQKLLNVFSASLKKGGHLLINTWSLGEIIFKTFSERTWTNVENLRCLYESKICFHPTRIETTSTFIDVSGKQETRNAIDYIYSINEMDRLIGEAGMSIKHIFSIPGKKAFEIGDPRAYLIVSKIE